MLLYTPFTVHQQTHIVYRLSLSIDTAHIVRDCSLWLYALAVWYLDELYFLRLTNLTALFLDFSSFIAYEWPSPFLKLLFHSMPVFTIFDIVFVLFICFSLNTQVASLSFWGWYFPEEFLIHYI